MWDLNEPDVFLAVDADSGDVELCGCAEDANGNLAAVCSHDATNRASGYETQRVGELRSLRECLMCFHPHTTPRTPPHIHTQR